MLNWYKTLFVYVINHCTQTILVSIFCLKSSKLCLIYIQLLSTFYLHVSIMFCTFKVLKYNGFAGARIEQHLEGSQISNIDRIASGHIKQLLIKVVAPIIKSSTNPPDFLEEYKNEYGYLGPALHSAVVKARTQPTPPVTVSSSVPGSAITSVGATITRAAPPTAIVQQVYIFCLYFL